VDKTDREGSHSVFTRVACRVSRAGRLFGENAPLARSRSRRRIERRRAAAGIDAMTAPERERILSNELVMTDTQWRATDRSRGLNAYFRDARASPERERTRGRVISF